jgi:hypothetical protein
MCSTRANLVPQSTPCIHTSSCGGYHVATWASAGAKYTRVLRATHAPQPHDLEVSGCLLEEGAPPLCRKSRLPVPLLVPMSLWLWSYFTTSTTLDTMCAYLHPPGTACQHLRWLQGQAYCQIPSSAAAATLHCDNNGTTRALLLAPCRQHTPGIHQPTCMTCSSWSCSKVNNTNTT